MSEAQLINTGAWLIAGLIGLLIAVLGWVGRKMVAALERMNDKIDEVSEVLHGRVTDLDRRVTRVESNMQHHLNSFAQTRPAWPSIMGK